MKINHKVLALWRACSDDIGRSNLRGLRFAKVPDRSVWRVEVTDGHWCVRAEITTEDDTEVPEFFIPPDIAQEVFKAARKAAKTSNLENLVTVTLVGEVLQAFVVGGTQAWSWKHELVQFPNLDRVIPKPDRAPSLKADGVCLSLDILADVRAVLKDIDRYSVGVIFKIDDDQAPIRIEVPNPTPLLDLIFIVMPITR